MSNKSGGKKYARDVQKRTGWSYSFCLQLVQRVGYEEVSRLIDDSTDLAATSRALNDRLRAAPSAADAAAARASSR